MHILLLFWLLRLNPSYSTTVVTNQPSTFVDGNESDLISLLNRVESELKVYVYPIPPRIRRCEKPAGSGGFPQTGSRVREMFQMEELIPNYYRNATAVLTNNPDEADVFIIDHEWICLRVGNEEFARKNGALKEQ